jgi:hydrogenase maturation protein HypF
MNSALPRPAPARVLAAGAWLKNRACRIDGRAVRWSPPHGDLATPEACRALADSLRALVAAGPLDAIAHDAHPDFASTHLAQALAAELGVPAVPVQHHHAHIGVLLAEAAHDAPMIGLALDGVGLGSDGTAWGGELLWAHGARWQRLGHLGTLALPGGDVAAREPWRMAAALLQALGRSDQIVPRLGPRVGEPLARGVQAMLARGLHCPPTTSAGRWFDAAAGLLGFSDRQTQEAEAAVALERAATAWLAGHPDPRLPACGLDLRALGQALADASDPAEGAAVFHLTLARVLADAAIEAARSHGVGQVALGGGCFFNRLLTQRLVAALKAAGLQAQLPQADRGDAGLALGQAWVAAHTVAADLDNEPRETTACA